MLNLYIAAEVWNANEKLMSQAWALAKVLEVVVLWGLDGKKARPWNEASQETYIQASDYTWCI